MTRFYYLNHYRILHHRGVRKSIPTDGWVTWSLERPPKSCRMNLIPVNMIQGSIWIPRLLKACFHIELVIIQGVCHWLLFYTFTHQHLEHFFGVCVDLDELPIQSRNLDKREIFFLPCIKPTERQTLEQKCHCWRVSWPRGRSCPSSPSPPPAAWWRFLWLDHVGYASSDVSHSYDRRTRHKSSMAGSYFAVSVQFYYICFIFTRVSFSTHPAILLRKGLLGMIAISSHTLLLVWKSLPRRV